MAAAGDLRSLLGAAQFNTLSRDMQVSKNYYFCLICKKKFQISISKFKIFLKAFLSKINQVSGVCSSVQECHGFVTLSKNIPFCFQSLLQQLWSTHTENLKADLEKVSKEQNIMLRIRVRSRVLETHEGEDLTRTIWYTDQDSNPSFQKRNPESWSRNFCVS
jgi:hypothetical protein